MITSTIFALILTAVPTRAANTISSACAQALRENAARAALETFDEVLRSEPTVDEYVLPSAEWTVVPRGGQIADHRARAETLRFKTFFEARGYVVTLHFVALGTRPSDSDPRYDFDRRQWPMWPTSRVPTDGSFYVRLRRRLPKCGQSC